MPFAAALSQHPLATHAVGEAVGQVLDAVGDRPDAAVLLVTGGFAGAMEDIAATVRATLRPDALVGATAGATLACGTVADRTPAVALLAMRFGPRRRFSDGALARAVTFDVSGDRNQDVRPDGPVDEPGATLIVLADPMSFPSAAYLRGLAASAPGLSVAGGLASAPDRNLLVADGAVRASGGVGLVLPAVVRSEVVVARGGQAVGEPLVVTAARGSLVDEIAGRPALDVLMETARGVDPQLRRRMAHGLHLAVADAATGFGPGCEDLDTRPVLGADRSRRALSVGGPVAVGSAVRFLVRDAESFGDDLRRALHRSTGDASLVLSGSDRLEVAGEAFADAAVVHEHGGGPSAGMSATGVVASCAPGHLVDAMCTTVVRFTDPALS